MSKVTIFKATTLSAQEKFISYGNMAEGKQNSKPVRNFYGNVEAARNEYGFVPAGFKVTLEALTTEELNAALKHRNAGINKLDTLINGKQPKVTKAVEATPATEPTA